MFPLVCGLFLWFYVTTDNQFDHTQYVSLRVINKPSGYILAEPIPSRARVRFRGKGKNLLSLGYRDKRIEIDLQERAREAVIPLEPGMIKGIPSGAEIHPLRIVEPETVRVRLDRFAAKMVPVKPAMVLLPLDGYTQVGSVVLDPDSVVVSGPKGYVDEILEVSTEDLEYKNLLKEIRGKIALASAGRATLNYSSRAVEFKADIQRIGERVMTEIPIVVLNVPARLKVTAVPSTLSLRIQGGVNVLSKLRKEDVVASIDYGSRHRYRGEKVPANIQVPPGITFSESRPESFELVVER